MKKRKGRGVDGTRERGKRKWRKEGTMGDGPREGLVYVLWFFTTWLYGGGSRSSKVWRGEKKASFELFEFGSVIFLAVDIRNIVCRVRGCLPSVTCIFQSQPDYSHLIG